MASRLTSGAAVDRHDSERHHTAVINLLDTRNDRIEEETAGVSRTTAEYDNSYYDEDNYFDNEEEDYELSGDVELPRGRPKTHCPLNHHYCSCPDVLTREAFAVVLTLSSSRFSRYVQQAEGQCQPSGSGAG